jgi:RNA polymerase primary sigma factor
VGRVDPSRQVELDELLAALAAAESVSPDDPMVMYVREIASLEPLQLDREADLIAAIRRGDEASRHRLTELNLWGVVLMARPFIGRGVSFLDLVQEGNLGLMRAVSEVSSGQGSFPDLRDAQIREAIEDAFD